MSVKAFKLIRVAYIPDGTFGVLFDGETPFCLTLEREWKDNKRGESCIPMGTYSCKRVVSPKFGDTFEVCDVPGRSHILFHKGNLEDDSHGCILIGEEYGRFRIARDISKVAVLSSGRGFKEFRERTNSVDDFELKIRDVLLVKK
jgi:hypothetical protein